VLAHAPDLAVEALGKNDAEAAAALLPYEALISNGIQYGHATAHVLHELGCHCLVHIDDVFLFVVVAGAQYFINDIAVIGQEDEAIRVFIQPAYRENALRVIDEVDDIGAVLNIGGGGNPNRLIEGYIYRSLFGLGVQGFAVYSYYIAGVYTVAGQYQLIIYRNTRLLYEFICIAAGTKTRGTDEFIETDEIFINVGHGVKVLCFVRRRSCGLS